MINDQWSQPKRGFIQILEQSLSQGMARDLLEEDTGDLSDLDFEVPSFSAFS